jgi:hypothetical protein
MSDYIVFGKKGSGKSLVCVNRIREALLRGAPVATNLDLKLEELLPHGVRDARVYRLPDRPTIDDLRAIGRGSESVDESTYGVVVLDECATMLNARTYNDKGRTDMLDWFVHSRKLGWDSYFLCQNPVQIDKQVRESLAEFMVSCKRLDKMRVPFIGAISKHLIGGELRPPKVHIATVRYGSGHEAIISDRWTYRGTHLYAAYDTQQVFRADYPHGIFCYLTPWHLKGRFGSSKKRSFLQDLLSSLVDGSNRAARPDPKPAHPLVHKLKNLPPDERIAHFRRLQMGGLL